MEKLKEKTIRSYDSKMRNLFKHLQNGGTKD